jgi:hypothetical protein
LTTAGLILGTPDYIAPEQALDSRHADIRSDIYSLGCTLYYLLVGKTPFDRGSAMTKMLGHMYQPPGPIAERRDDLPADVLTILEKMMAKDPSERYQAPAEVALALAPLARVGPSRPDDTITTRVEPEAVPAPPLARTDTLAAAVNHAAGARPSNLVLFVARCPYCPSKLRVPEKALGASVPCPQCGSFFTAVPEEDCASPFLGPASRGKLNAHGSPRCHSTLENFAATCQDLRSAQERLPDTGPWFFIALVLGSLALLLSALPYLQSCTFPLSVAAIALALTGFATRK